MPMASTGKPSRARSGIHDQAIGLADHQVGLAPGGSFDKCHHGAGIGHIPAAGRTVEVWVGSDIRQIAAREVAQLPQFLVSQGCVEAQYGIIRMDVIQGKAMRGKFRFQVRRTDDK